ncbi:unnamed protein product [Leptidea sinapis]|uniref:Uncharacterized protein n=1 Tax=Leptidea sinapis TaxID=189913 RepID=A0A5E4QDX6_9NEOP|nr:unnamed protein product [Leptidea sinapis]
MVLCCNLSHLVHQQSLSYRKLNWSHLDQWLSGTCLCCACVTAPGALFSVMATQPPLCQAPLSGGTQHVLKTGLVGRFAVSVVDNLVIIHHQQCKVENKMAVHVPVVPGVSLKPAFIDEQPCPMSPLHYRRAARLSVEGQPASRVTPAFGDRSATATGTRKAGDIPGAQPAGERRRRLLGGAGPENGPMRR